MISAKAFKAVNLHLSAWQMSNPGRPIIVGLGHTAGVGKDAAAKILITDFGFVRLSIADLIRDFVREIDPIVQCGARGEPWRLSDLIDDNAGSYEAVKRRYDEVRRLLQETGRVAREQFGPNFWVDQLEAKIGLGRYIITDVRYPSEAALVKKHGGPVFKIFRPGVSPLPHETDMALRDYDGWDGVLLNDKEVEDIQNELLWAVAEFYEYDHERVYA